MPIFAPLRAVTGGYTTELHCKGGTGPLLAEIVVTVEKALLSSECMPQTPKPRRGVLHLGVPVLGSPRAPSESPSWVTVPPAEPEQWSTCVEQHLLGLGLGTTLPTDGATQGAYGRFHAFTWRPRLRWVVLALTLLSIAELASELSSERSADAPFSARLRSQHPTAGRAGLVLAVLLRCSAVGVTAASTFTRWPPLQSLLTRRCAPAVPLGAVPLLCP